jgi:hypothetical protein
MSRLNIKSSLPPRCRFDPLVQASRLVLVEPNSPSAVSTLSSSPPWRPHADPSANASSSMSTSPSAYVECSPSLFYRPSLSPRNDHSPSPCESFIDVSLDFVAREMLKSKQTLQDAEVQTEEVLVECSRTSALTQEDQLTRLENLEGRSQSRSLA